MKALTFLFPNIGLDPDKFKGSFYIYILFFLNTNTGTGLWSDIMQRKQVFLNVAKDNEISPTNPEHWYTVSFEHLFSQKVKSIEFSFNLLDCRERGKFCGTTTAITLRLS